MPTVSRLENTSLDAALRAVSMRDPRAVETASELDGVVRRHLATQARLHRFTQGSAEWIRAHAQVEDLREQIRELEQTLVERPWTEV